MDKSLKDIAIVLTAHPAQQKFWAPVLQCFERYPGPMILSYDDIDTAMIPQEIMMQFDETVVTGYPPGQLGHEPGELVCMRNGFQAAGRAGCEYVVKIGFDTCLFFWRRLPEFFGQFRTVDIIDAKTAAIFGRTDALVKILTGGDIETRKGSAESFYLNLTGKLQVKRKYMPGEWWFGQLGYIHLHGEYALNAGKPVGWTWKIGELWPRK